MVKRPTRRNKYGRKILEEETYDIDIIELQNRFEELKESIDNIVLEMSKHRQSDLTLDYIHSKQFEFVQILRDIYSRIAKE